jgi:DNA-binding CsgD family transcriptional regulator
MPPGPPALLHGRSSECEVLDGLLNTARAGRSSVLVLRGESGCGKTALLEYALDRASGCRTARIGGVESEMELAFAGLHQLVAPALERLERLARPQQDALRVAFGQSQGATPDRFLVSLAVLNLLSEVAGERPLVCVVDDAQWLDRASIQCLAFVARRLAADPLALIFAVREPSHERELISLPELVVQGVGQAAAQVLLTSAIQGRLDEQVRDRIVAETRGNPLALLELARGLTPAQLAGGFGLASPPPLASRISQSFVRQVRMLPEETQWLLLLAAAEPVGDVTLLWRAGDLLGLTIEAATPAQTAGLIELGVRVRFRHPLLRSAVYRAAGLEDRRRVHRALAEATDPAIDPDRRIWHRAHAAKGPDEAVAGELERSAQRARGRGGVAAAAAFLERATELTPDPGRRGARALVAAQAKLDAGAPDTTSELLATAAMCPLDEPQIARLERLRAQVAYVRTRGRDGPELLLQAAQRLAPIDPALARETYLEALWAAIRAGRFASGRGLIEIAEAARNAPEGQGPARAVDFLLDGLVARATQGYEVAVPVLERAVAALRSEGLPADDIGWCWLACHTAMDLWDDEACAELSGKLVQVARDQGALATLPFALNYVAAHHIFAGEFGSAAPLIEEADAIAVATGGVRIADFSVLLAAWRGHRAQTLQLREAIIQDATVRGEGLAITLAEWAGAVLYNGLGEYGEALAAGQRSAEHDALGFGVWVLPELVESAARSGNQQVAADTLGQLVARTRPSSTEWARGIEARSRALLSQGAIAEGLYVEAIERIGRCRITVHLARAHLIYGEWLRRENRRTDAREQLRVAHTMLDSMGAEAFAERARRELLSTGATVRKRTREAANDLTAQEALIGQMACDGRTSPEIGAQLFISRRTVEWHLRKVFTKLDVHSRTELRAALSPQRQALPTQQ